MIRLYFLGALISGSVLLSAFFKDESTPNSDLVSWVIVIIAASIWPLALVLTVRERRHRRRKRGNIGHALERVVEEPCL